MQVQFTFREINAAPDFTDAEIISSAVDFVMENFFPEWEETEIFHDFTMADINLTEETVSLELAPVWLRETCH